MIGVSTSIEFIEFTDEGTTEGAVQGLVVHEASSTAIADLTAAIEQLRPQHEELLVLAADHSFTTIFQRVTRLLAQSEAATASLVEAMFVARNTVSPAAASQAQRNAEARQELIDEFNLYDSDKVHQLSGSSASNRSAAASRWLAAGKIFAVVHQSARRYPTFQFGADGQPRAVIARVLEAFAPYGLDGWEIALWFTTHSGWLDDQRPVDLLTRAPDAIAEAAHQTFEEVAA